MSQLISFPDCPSVRPVNPIVTDLWEVEEDYSILLSRGRKLLIKKGFRMDGASIPRMFWRVVGHPFQLPLLPCALAHDGLYAAELLPRGECDWEFLSLQELAGIGWAKRNTIYSAVRAGGVFVWGKHTPASISEARRFCSIR